MYALILVVHCLLAVALIGIVLLQRSEGGGLGIGGGNMGNMMSARGTANFLTRMTSLLAAAFLGTSLILAILAGPNFQQGSLIEKIAAENTEQDMPDQAPESSQAPPAAPATPAPPVSQ